MHASRRVHAQWTQVNPHTVPLPQAGEGIADLDVSECPRGSGDTSSCRASGDEPCRSLSALEEEVKALREENLSLQHALAVAQHSASTHRNALTTLTQERDALRKKVGLVSFSFWLSCWCDGICTVRKTWCWMWYEMYIYLLWYTFLLKRAEVKIIHFIFIVIIYYLFSMCIWSFAKV